MSTVVDLGCASYAHSTCDSISLLIERFTPDRLYGFDPALGHHSATDYSGAAEVLVSKEAAWIWDGVVDFTEDGVASTVVLNGHPMLPPHMQHEPLPVKEIACFDLAEWLYGLPGDRVVLKMDVEGAEFLLIPWLLATGAIYRVGRLLVEWHTQTRDRDAWRAAIEETLERRGCIVEEWAY